METIDSEGKCARCAVTPSPLIFEDHGATSRASMEELPTIKVCVACREREAFRGSAGLRMIPYEEWPISLAELMAEERLRLSYLREHAVSELLAARRRRERANLAS